MRTKGFPFAAHLNGRSPPPLRHNRRVVKVDDVTEETKEEYGAWLKARIVSAKHDNHSFYFYFYPLFVDSAECIVFVEFLFPNSFRRPCLVHPIRCVPGMDKRLVAFPAFRRTFFLDGGKGMSCQAGTSANGTFGSNAGPN